MKFSRLAKERIISEPGHRMHGVIAGSVGILLSMCLCAEARGQGTSTKNSAINVAREYVEKNLPNEARILTYKTYAIDRGNSWIITFMPPGEAQTGGVPEIYVDKKSLKVNKVERAQ